MTCLSELTCAVYADGELSPAETRDAERHLAECPRCRALVTALRAENRSLAVALTELAPSAAEVTLAPARDVVGSQGNGRWTWLAAGLGLAGLAGVAGWADLAGRSAGDWIGLGVEALLFVVMNAETLERALTLLAVGVMATLGCAGALYLGRTPSRAVAALALALGATVATLPSPSEALETRSGRDVVIGAGETLDTTLVAAGESVRIDGTIDGDLIVAGAHVDVRGTVRGNLVALARAVDVTGTVEGSIYVGARAVTLGGHVGRGLYAAARTTTIETGARVERDLTLAGRSVALRGDVGRQATILAHDAAVAGRVARDLRFRGDRLAVETSGRVEGAIHADVTRASGVTVDGGASVTGPVLTRVNSRASGWHRAPRVWFWAAASFFGAALLGWAGLALAPGFVMGSAEGVRSWGRSFGWGVAALVGTPVVILALAVTLVGLPIALVLLGLYLLGVYAAKIVVGLALGRTLLHPRGNPRRDALRALVVGLALITVATAVPWWARRSGSPWPASAPARSRGGWPARRGLCEARGREPTGRRPSDQLTPSQSDPVSVEIRTAAEILAPEPAREWEARRMQRRRSAAPGDLAGVRRDGRSGRARDGVPEDGRDPARGRPGARRRARRSRPDPAGWRRRGARVSVHRPPERFRRDASRRPAALRVLRHRRPRRRADDRRLRSGPIALPPERRAAPSSTSTPSTARVTRRRGASRGSSGAGGAATGSRATSERVSTSSGRKRSSERGAARRPTVTARG